MGVTTCWLKPPFGRGEPKEIEATPDEIARWMVAGWSQCDPPAPANEEEVTEDVS